MDDQDQKISKINGAMLKMIRLDKSLSTINEISNNLLAFNPQYQVFNFELKFTMIDAIFQECESKMEKEEKEDMHLLRDAIAKFIIENPIIIKTQNHVNKSENKFKIDKLNFTILSAYLFKYESSCRKMTDKYGMDTMYGDIENEGEY